MSFKGETLEKIDGREIAEYQIRANISQVVNRRKGQDRDLIFQGKGNTIPWEKMEELTGLVEDYDSGFGADTWCGWITFTDGTWIVRRFYDGSEWWESINFPTLDTVTPDKFRGEFSKLEYTVVSDTTNK